MIDEAGHRIEPNSRVECWLLSAHYAEQDIEEVRVSDPCQCEHMEWNYTCETVRFSLQSIDCAKCCKDYEWKCGRESASAIRRDGATRLATPARVVATDTSAITSLSCRQAAECKSWCEIDEPCGSVRVDLHNGVPLACVKLVRDNCDGWAFGEVDACGPRRLVKRNDLLFDLIQGCDLTTSPKSAGKNGIAGRSQSPLTNSPKPLAPRGMTSLKYVTEDFWVKFSRPVNPDTLRPDCFAMTVMTDEGEGGWWQTYRVPISRPDTIADLRSGRSHIRSEDGREWSLAGGRLERYQNQIPGGRHASRDRSSRGFHH